MGSNTPSPANVCSSITLKLPPSSVSPLELVSHSARAGRDAPERSFQMDTFSAPMGEFTIGTSAERFLAIVMGSFSLYSNRSPSSRAAAAEGTLNTPPPTPPPPPGPTTLPLPLPEPRPGQYQKSDCRTPYQASHAAP